MQLLQTGYPDTTALLSQTIERTQSLSSAFIPFFALCGTVCVCLVLGVEPFVLLNACLLV